MHSSARWELGTIQNPLRGFLHASAAMLSVAGVFLLLARGPEGVPGRLALGIFGSSLVVVYTVSTLYHTIRWGRSGSRGC